MKILALVGSPRKKGNTDILIDTILCACRRHKTEKIYVYDHKISPCMDCRACQKGNHSCRKNDGMKEIYPRIQKADLIIFGTPLYWYAPTGQMKLLIDRLRPFIASKKLKGKKAVIVVPAAEGPKACKAIVEMFEQSFDYLGMKLAGKILATAYEKGEVAKNAKELKKAHDLGVSL
ncbi:hypothetical protein COS16_01645 [Candidatus Desantisbacteria bacterium CG02_land_8_20_14_3_00_49_13]|nr:MAG: hypothetical protein AUJ67_07580 [Candidatus Desantisbacteria bacterium CG1_02_49_89]PIV57178.1 MAG: hypothetical protein COS16_01645 [Candidatus Desantisbacteria bacterium CG02_land_8_20_14_3_00_49_13]